MKVQPPCSKCSSASVTRTAKGDNLCGTHYVASEDDACLLAHLQSDISLYGKIMEPRSIQRAIKRMRPEVFSQLEPYFQADVCNVTADDVEE